MANVAGNHKQLKPFKKGKDPRRNSTGKNLGSHWLKTDLEILLKTVGENQSTPYGQLLNKRIIKEAIENGNLGFAKMIYEYIEGKPVETHDTKLTGEFIFSWKKPKSK